MVDVHSRCEPGRLNKLMVLTKFSKHEIRMLYQGFKQASRDWAAWADCDLTFQGLSQQPVDWQEIDISILKFHF